ncbi:MAG: chloride channel protein [Bdellovibrionales bacterium]
MNSFIEFSEKLTSLLSRLPKRQGQKLYFFLTDQANLQNLGLWISAVVAALISVGYAMLFRWLEGLGEKIYALHSGYWAFLAAPAFFVLAWLVVRRFAPEAAGSGIPQIMAANEIDHDGPHRPYLERLLSPRVLVTKVLSSLLCVAGGGAIGREGPTLQISAGVFYLVGRQIRKVAPGFREQTWIVAGAAAGLASAFNTPLGGIVYAIEELGVVQFHKIRTALISAVIVSGLVAQWILGNYLYLGFPRLEVIGFSFLPWSLLVGAIAGYLGGSFGRILYILAISRQRLGSQRKLLLLSICCGLIMAMLYQLERRAVGPGIEVITGLLFHDETSSSTLAATRFLGTMVSYLSGAAGGIFSPSLATGGAIGALLEDILRTGHPNLMVLLGMIGFLTGVTRTPFTAFILVLEMTDRHSAVFPMMMAALAAQSAAHFTDRKSFYERMKERFLPSETKTNGPRVAARLD